MPLPIVRSTSGLTLSCRTFVSRNPQPLSRLLSCSYSASAASRHDRPFRMAVVGSGPAGFYTAYRVMSLIDRAKVDMYEALPVPFGLVRFGVAPDHPEVKVFYYAPSYSRRAPRKSRPSSPYACILCSRLLIARRSQPSRRTSLTQYCAELPRQVLRGCFLSELYIRWQRLCWPQTIPSRRPISPLDHTAAPL